MLYKISNIEQDSNNSSELFQTILTNCDYQEDNKDDGMDVDEDPALYRQKDNNSGQLQFLKGYRFRSKDVSEEVLCKDLIFIFQGIDGQNISFSIIEDAFVLAPNINVSDSTRKIISEM